MILGIDYGRRRIGIAIADLETRIATPLTTLAGRHDVTRDARSVADLGAEKNVGAFVVGLPLNMDDSDSPQTALARRFAAELGRLSKLPVHFQDERLTTVAAQEVMDAAGVRPKQRKGLTDRIAAGKILQAYLDRS